MGVRGGPVAQDDSAPPVPLAFPKEEQSPRDHALCASQSYCLGRAEKHPLCDLTLHPKVNGLHAFSPNHLNKKGTEKVKYNHLVQSREQRENILHSRINCPSSKCHWGESYNETGEKHWTVEEIPEGKEKPKN